MVYIGTAAWSIPKSEAGRFPEEGSGLSRYAAVLNGVEVNTSFYRRHKPETWRRWADSVPSNFRFSVKMPQRISHDLRLAGAEVEVDLFLADINSLGDKLGPVLVQLPPSLTFEPHAAEPFFERVRAAFTGRLVIEPRHPSWSSVEAGALMASYDVAPVAPDPSRITIPPPPDGKFLYLRLHGSPRVYYSSYGSKDIVDYRARLDAASADSWCVFDNTASGAALPNALEMLDLAGHK